MNTELFHSVNGVSAEAIDLWNPLRRGSCLSRTSEDAWWFRDKGAQKWTENSEHVRDNRQYILSRFHVIQLLSAGPDFLVTPLVPKFQTWKSQDKLYSNRELRETYLWYCGQLFA